MIVTAGLVTECAALQLSLSEQIHSRTLIPKSSVDSWQPSLYSGSPGPFSKQCLISKTNKEHTIQRKPMYHLYT